MEFDREYQEELLLRMSDRRFMEEVSKDISEELFEPCLQPVAKKCLAHFKATGHTLSRRQMRQLCGQNGVSLNGVGKGSVSFDRDAVLDFARYRVLRDAFAKAHFYHESGDFDKAVSTVAESVNSFPKTSSSIPPDILVTKIRLFGRTGIIPTGLPRLDTELQGGVAAGDLAVILAPTSGGKTSMMIYIGGTAVEQGKKVYHATLETPEYEAMAKYRARMTGEAVPSPAVWYKKAKALHQTGGWLRVKEYPPNTASVKALDYDLPDDTDMLVIDYADDLLPPSNARGNLYEDLGHIYSELKRVGMQRKIPVWTASQTNREGYDTLAVKTRFVSGSLKKMMIADQVISINQDDSDKEQNPSGDCCATLEILKNRHGPPKGRVPVTVNYAKCKFITL